MNWEDLRTKLKPAKDWIILNQLEDGSISWDQRGKCDPWDHCECLIALAIYEEWDAFDKGVDWFFNNINKDGLISPEFKNQQSVYNHFESHHAPYIVLPLMQAMLIKDEESFPKEYSPQINNIFDQLENFKDDDGYYYWAKDKKGLSDNSLITATMSILLSLTARHERSFSIDTSKWDQKFDRDGTDRSRFSMDFYYPYLARVKNNKQEFDKHLEEFYVKGLGVKCVKEEPWVTIAESSECVLAALVNGNVTSAENIFNDILQFQDSAGIFPTGYQYDLKIFWPEEKSTWTNAAVIIAGHALCAFKDINERKGSNVFVNLSNFNESN